MTRSGTARAWLAGMTLALVAGCGGAPIRGVTRVTLPTSEIVRAHRALLILPAPAKPDWQIEGKELTSKLARSLEALGLFTAILEGSGPASDEHADIDLVLAIRDVTRVTASEREKLGDSAGQVMVAVDVKIHDRADKTDAGTASFEAAGYSGKLGGTTEDAENEIVKRITAYVAGLP